jgi:hypothetical protein
MARRYLRRSAKELVKKAVVVERTIKRMVLDEGFRSRGDRISKAVDRTLMGADIVLVPENGGGVGVRIRKATAGDVPPVKHPSYVT